MIIKLKKALLLLGITFWLSGCSSDDGFAQNNDEQPNNSINKIMPLGASRVQGNRPAYESYRYELWKDLIDGNYTFDYIGTVDDEGTYPNYNNISFDINHEGRGGWTSGQILNGIEGWLNQAGIPDIVLFSSPGGNDALIGLSFDNAINNINTIIDILQTANPNITIIIEQMAPAKSSEMTPELTTYFNQLNSQVLQISAAKTTANSKVIPVDMFTGFTDDLLADAVHYNEAGANFVAQRYYNILIDVLEE
ncbi:MAG: hypothetical protein ED556_00185 [Winogradskyella sp.]|uniref:GDSL-type esterase/lipase family protein n=1 Tax=Winogradskyella sp. TaxID=1883156 RepID=UPI000F40F7B7|nr:GDSL-type esterase/lipase family protein [Winogradskyella sp.]RNC87645.1 MAG: hypothetical protein ED556_00185 [Winogradskyella sp.]